MAKTDLNGYRTMFSTHTQNSETPEVSQGQSRSQRVALAAVPEEEEGSTQTQMMERLQALKRKQAETDTPPEVAEATGRALKKRAVESVGSVNPSQSVPTQTRAPQRSLSKPTSQTAAGRTKSREQSQGPEGAEPGKPDTDENFLTAVASKKRGKKHEDDYDREFNDLRISKPTLPEPEEDWEIMDDFGDDSDLRGNFMVIVEIDVFKKGDTPLEPYRVAGGRADWEGRPNFKKFKQVRHLFETAMQIGQRSYRKQQENDEDQSSSCANKKNLGMILWTSNMVSSFASSDQKTLNTDCRGHVRG